MRGNVSSVSSCRAAETARRVSGAAISRRITSRSTPATGRRKISRQPPAVSRQPSAIGHRADARLGGGVEPRGSHITRRGFVLAGFALFGAPEPSPVAGVLDRLATDLSQSDTAAFLSHFDPSMPGYDRLSGFIRALSDQADVGSSIEIVTDSGNDRRRTLVLDWILEITGKDASGSVERRRQQVRCTFERRGKKWIVTALDPIQFFAPPHKIALP